MSKYGWVALGMLTSAFGGASGVWIALVSINQIDNQSAEATSNLIGYGGVFAALVGGVVSLSRGRTRERQPWLRSLLALVCGLGIGATVSPSGTLLAVNPLCLLLLIGVWPFALLGGLSMLGLIWAILWAVGVALNRADQKAAPELPPLGFLVIDARPRQSG